MSMSGSTIGPSGLLRADITAGGRICIHFEGALVLTDDQALVGAPKKPK